MKRIILTGMSLFSISLYAHPLKVVLTEASLLDEAKIEKLYFDSQTGLAVARVNSFQEGILSRKSHEQGRCGGFETLKVIDSAQIKSFEKEFSKSDFQKSIDQINHRKKVDSVEESNLLNGKSLQRRFKKRRSVSDAIAQIDASKVKGWVDWLSSFPTRYHKSSSPNKHVVALKDRLDQEVLSNYPQLKVETTLIQHTTTPQQTLRLRIPGTSKSEETVVLGAHLDSIKMGFFGADAAGRSPGSDDDASGSASLLEALRLVLKAAPFERSVEFFWYAGEEAGLLGSAEVAKSYNSSGRKVVGVMQLDMTLFAGSGKGKIASMTDYTSPELRQLLANINSQYVGVEIVDDKCGYGCSDHASWYKNGFPTLMPTEATFNQMNKKIHTSDDAVNSSSDFDHAATFSKFAVAFVDHLAK